ncbi:MAG: DUF2029 domain-containing protein [Anaerolineae bacterium]|nr:DUF2029 domain-containing protein [Anaerolineae bacterium]NIN93952.1 DUF2029 domain-containing protein [Anaerolineae bacterium]
MNTSLIVVFILLVLPLYVDKGLHASFDHANGSGTVGGIDFKAYYIAADMLRTRRDFYDVELQTDEVLARGLPLNESFYIYPPLLAMVFLPLTAVSIQTAAQLWFFFNLVLYGVALVLICRSLELSRFTRMLPLLWILAFLFPPVLFNLHKGQVNIVVLLLLALTYCLYRRGLDAAAGVALGSAVMIKVIPVFLLLYFVWKRRVVLSLAALATIVVIGVLGLLIVGVGPHATYLTEVMPSLAEPRPNPSNQSLGGFFSLLLIRNSYADNIIHNPGLWKGLTWTLSLALVASVVAVSSRHEGAVHSLELEIGLVIATMPLISNIAWVDMLVLLLFPYAVILKYSLTARTGALRVSPESRLFSDPLLGTALLGSLFASALLVSSPRFVDLLFNVVRWHPGLVRSPLLLSLPFYGSAILWLTLAFMLVYSRKLVRSHDDSLHARPCS